MLRRNKREAICTELFIKKHLIRHMHPFTYLAVGLAIQLKYVKSGLAFNASRFHLHRIFGIRFIAARRAAEEQIRFARGAVYPFPAHWSRFDTLRASLAANLPHSIRFIKLRIVEQISVSKNGSTQEHSCANGQKNPHKNPLFCLTAE